MESMKFYDKNKTINEVHFSFFKNNSLPYEQANMEEVGYVQFNFICSNFYLRHCVIFKYIVCHEFFSKYFPTKKGKVNNSISF